MAGGGVVDIIGFVRVFRNIIRGVPSEEFTGEEWQLNIGGRAWDAYREQRCRHHCFCCFPQYFDAESGYFKSMRSDTPNDGPFGAVYVKGKRVEFSNSRKKKKEKKRHG